MFGMFTLKNVGSERGSEITLHNFGVVPNSRKQKKTKFIFAQLDQKRNFMFIGLFIKPTA